MLSYSVECTVFTPKCDDPWPTIFNIKKIPVYSVFNFVHNHTVMSVPQFSDNDPGRNYHLILILFHHCTNFHTSFHTYFMTYAWNHHYSCTLIPFSQDSLTDRTASAVSFNQPFQTLMTFKSSINTNKQCRSL